MLRRIGQAIPITSFVSGHHTPSEDSSSESTTSTGDSHTENSNDSESSSTSESSETADRSQFCRGSESADACRESVDPLQLKLSKDSLQRLKRLREHAMNNDGDGGECSLSSPSAAKRLAVGNPLPMVVSADPCDNLLDGCKSPVKLNGKSQPCSESANSVGEICDRLPDSSRNVPLSESHDGGPVSSDVGTVGTDRQSSSSTDQELCSILNPISNGDATGVDGSSSEHFHSRRRRTKSGSRRYRQTVDADAAEQTTDED